MCIWIIITKKIQGKSLVFDIDAEPEGFGLPVHVLNILKKEKNKRKKTIENRDLSCSARNWKVYIKIYLFQHFNQLKTFAHTIFNICHQESCLICVSSLHYTILHYTTLHCVSEMFMSQ